MDSITIVSTIITALATAMIALYAFKSHKLSIIISKMNGEYQSNNKKLLHSLILANIVNVSGDRSLGKTLLTFLRLSDPRIRLINSKEGIKILEKSRVANTITEKEYNEALEILNQISPTNVDKD